MKPNIFNIGVDTGYSDTKTQDTSFPTGYLAYTKPPYSVEEYLFFNDMYYVTDSDRIPFEKDRTSNNNVFILTLFAIAKQMTYFYQVKGPYKQPDELQKKIDTIDSVCLGVGLPPAYIMHQAEALKMYYIKNFGDGVSFDFSGIHFHLKLEAVNVYPQDFAAALTYIGKEKGLGSGSFDYEDFHCIDIGGYTVDDVPVENNKPLAAKSISADLGVIRMYEDIISAVETRFGLTLKPRDLERIFLGKKTIIQEDVLHYVHEFADNWFTKVINSLTEKGVNFATTPIIFMGGGATLFKSNIEKHPALKAYKILENPKANAEAYATLNLAFMGGE